MFSTRKKFKYSISLLTFCLFGFFVVANLASATIGPLWDNKTPLTKSGEKVLTTENISEGTAGGKDKSNIRKGMQDILGQKDTGIEGVIKAEDDATRIKDHDTALKTTSDKISIGINYSLALLGVIALVYLLYHGFLIVVKGDIEEGKKGVRTACIAIIGIGLSRFIISFIFRLIKNIAPSNGTS